MLLRVKITPNAKTNQILGWADDPHHGRHLRIQLAAPPLNGKANKTAIAFIADSLRLSKSQVTLLKGQTARLKTLQIPDGTQLPL